MTLIKSISGIRGTIGGKPGESLSPLDIVKFTSAFAMMIKEAHADSGQLKVILGRDARRSGSMISNMVSSTLISLGFDVVDIGLTTTPTIEMAIPKLEAHAGIILTASHNPAEWNALKLMNSKGEFISALEGENLLRIADNELFDFADIDSLGSISTDDTLLKYHINEVVKHPLVDVEAIKNAGFKIAVDGINSCGGFAIPDLLEAMGVEHIEKIHCEPNGIFAHNPEPLAAHLTDISEVIVEKNLDLGIVVDPDVDRLAFVCEDGSMFGEEYTLVAVADYYISKKPGAAVSNLSSSLALRDVCRKYDQEYFASAVGEVNVVDKMKEKNAVIGGEGNGGIIDPLLHYGRDALIGTALFLTHLAKYGKSISSLRKTYPDYHISKNKIQLTPDIDVDEILRQLSIKYQNEEINQIDGLKIIFGNEWVHLRKSNTEPIIRIYSESSSLAKADQLAEVLMNDIKELTE